MAERYYIIKQDETSGKLSQCEVCADPAWAGISPVIYDCKLDAERPATQQDVKELQALGEVGYLLAEIRLYCSDCARCFEPRGRRLFEVRDKLRKLLEALNA